MSRDQPVAGNWLAPRQNIGFESAIIVWYTQLMMRRRR